MRSGNNPYLDANNTHTCAVWHRTTRVHSVEPRRRVTARRRGGYPQPPHPNSSRLVKAEHPDAILHAGDIGDLAVLAELRQIAPLFAVRGNIDVHGGPDLPDVLNIEITAGTAAGTRDIVLRILL